MLEALFLQGKNKSKFTISQKKTKKKRKGGISLFYDFKSNKIMNGKKRQKEHSNN